LNNEKAFDFADSYFNFMCSYRTKTKEEIDLHFLLLDEYNGKLQTAFIPPPDENDDWDSMDKNEVRKAVVCSIATIRPEFLLTATEAWAVLPSSDMEISVVMAYKRSYPDAPLSEYPGAKEILNLMLEGNGVLRTYISEIIDGAAGTPEITNVEKPPVKMAGVFNGMWDEGMEIAMEGEDFN